MYDLLQPHTSNQLLLRSSIPVNPIKQVNLSKYTSKARREFPSANYYMKPSLSLLVFPPSSKSPLLYSFINPKPSDPFRDRFSFLRPVKDKSQRRDNPKFQFSPTPIQTVMIYLPYPKTSSSLIVVSIDPSSFSSARGLLRQERPVELTLETLELALALMVQVSSVHHYFLRDWWG